MEVHGKMTSNVSSALVLEGNGNYTGEVTPIQELSAFGGNNNPK